MRVNRLTHTVTHTRKCAERAKDERTDIPSAHLFYICSITCVMKLPMVWAASSCFCLVAWV